MTHVPEERRLVPSGSKVNPAGRPLSLSLFLSFQKTGSDYKPVSLIGEWNREVRSDLRFDRQKGSGSDIVRLCVESVWKTGSKSWRGRVICFFSDESTVSWNINCKLVPSVLRNCTVPEVDVHRGNHGCAECAWPCVYFL